MSTRSRILILAILGVSVANLGACKVGDQLEDQLEGEPCTEEADCWHTQECAHTIEEKFLNLPGVCQPEGVDCIPGRQIGCPCNPTDPSLNCSTSALPFALQAIYPQMVCHPTLFTCAVAPQGEANP